MKIFHTFRSNSIRFQLDRVVIGLPDLRPSSQFLRLLYLPLLPHLPLETSLPFFFFFSFSTNIAFPHFLVLVFCLFTLTASFCFLSTAVEGAVGIETHVDTDKQQHRHPTLRAKNMPSFFRKRKDNRQVLGFFAYVLCFACHHFSSLPLSISCHTSPTPLDD